MPTAIIDNLVNRQNLPLLTADNYQEFIDSHDYVLLFFCNNPQQFPECHDVAVILPELLQNLKGRLQAGIIDVSMQRDLQAKFRFSSWPALVFLKQGKYLGVITGMQSWSDFQVQTAAILASEPTPPPAFDLDKVCAPGKH